MTNKEKFKALVSDEKTDTLQRNKERIKNRARLRESQNIAMKILLKLDELGWSQKRFAEEMKVTPQQITKIVSGKENLTIDTQVKIQEILEIPILASFYEKVVEMLIATFRDMQPYEVKEEVKEEDRGKYSKGVEIKMSFSSMSNQYTSYKEAI